ncbi:MAG TPA: HlyD family efflux transporter periplasmic adaptor subunit [Aestuariivirgaceae bacterium]|jgi:HlyD family secretion protein|nr:HlyD family efflux transporter periplasmic adaptor subunit [Aestuariivirgaceae bacterium]
MTTFLCSLGLLAAILPFCPPAMPVHNGYIEGEYVLMAPREAGRIERMAVVEGQTVKAGDLLFKIDTSEISRQVDAAKARLAQAEAQLADLETGERREELAVLEAALAAQEAALADANRVMARQKDLYERRVVSKAALDDATAKRDSAEALTQQARRRIEVAKMPARGRAIDAARQHVESARADVAQMSWRESQFEVKAPADAVVDRVFRREGEMAASDKPALQLLPPGNRKVRFFVNEQERSSFAPGTIVKVSCDGCPDTLEATVSRVASQAEFTPPVIYSVESRDKLVYAVDARPDARSGATLHPGQPVDVRLQ